MPSVAESPSHCCRRGIPVPEPDCLTRAARRQIGSLDNEVRQGTDTVVAHRVLVVDDDADIADSLSGLLKMGGYSMPRVAGWANR